jgi:RND family efflux transporter MFP subunit
MLTRLAVCYYSEGVWTFLRRVIVVAFTAFIIIPVPVFADPLGVTVGSAQAILQLSPDPPHVGPVHGVITLTGASNDALQHTTASFVTNMPSMAMAGPGGSVKMSAPGRYEFDAMLGMAAAWDITVTFSGSVTGTAVYHISVLAGAAPTPPVTGAMRPMAGMSMATPVHSNMQGMAGMQSMKSMSSSSGDPGAWHIATYVLVLIVIAGLFVIVRARRERRPLIIGITIAAVVVTIILAAIQARYASPPMDMSAMSSVEGDAPIPVTLASVSSDTGKTTISAPGTISPYLTQDVVTRAAGILRDFTLYAGDRVHTGQTIAILDAPDLQSRANAAKADAEAQRDTARAAAIEAQHQAPNAVAISKTEIAVLDRNLAAAASEQRAKHEKLAYWHNEVRREATLLREGAVSQQEYEDELVQAAAAQAAADTAMQQISSLQQQRLAANTKTMDAVANVEKVQAEAAAADAQAAQAQANSQTESTLAGYTIVASPNNATVMKRLVDPGVYVAMGTPIMRLAVIDQLRVQANVAQSDLTGITDGTRMDVTLSNGKTIRGHVTSVAPVADPSTHTTAVEGIIANPSGDLTPGGFVRVTLHARATHTTDNLQVPSSALVGAGTNTAVWTNANGIAHRIAVKVISDDGTFASVSGRLAADARVVTEGAHTLEEGQAISEQRS